MDSTLYHSLLSDETAQKGLTRLKKAVTQELAARSYPVLPNIEEHTLGVSFPSDAGLTRYDIEITPDRRTVGKAFAVEHRHDAVRRGMMEILLFESPRTVVFEGFHSLAKMEVWESNNLMGTVIETGSDRTGKSFHLSSQKGEAELFVNHGQVSVNTGSQTHQYHLQLDTNYIPLFASANPDASVVYRPHMDCDGTVVMAFNLCLRMIFFRADFG